MAGRGARKPEHQWRVHAGVAVRRAPQSDAADPDKTEAFDIIDEQGVSVGAVTLGLTAQRIEHGLADASDLPDAVRCWLAARGARSIDLRDATGSSVARGPFDVRQLSGRAPTGPVRRIVSLAPSNADVITALECFDRVVACESSSEPPSEFSEVERLGPDLGPNLDRIAALEPDLVLSSLSVPGMERVVTQLRTRGIAQLVLAPRSLSEVMDDVRAVAQVLEVAARGESVVDAMRQEIAALRAGAAASDARARVPGVVAAADVHAGGRLLFGRTHRTGRGHQRVWAATGRQPADRSPGPGRGRARHLFCQLVRGHRGQARPRKAHDAPRSGGLARCGRGACVPAGRAL